ncbi:hypothetical protein [Vibrio phage RYC]|nr:hypothetical protein [Vibrio phage RYC]
MNKVLKAVKEVTQEKVEFLKIFILALISTKGLYFLCLVGLFVDSLLVVYAGLIFDGWYLTYTILAGAGIWFVMDVLEKLDPSLRNIRKGTK